MTMIPRTRMGLVAVATVGLLLTGCTGNGSPQVDPSSDSAPTGTMDIVRVPADTEDLQKAAELVAENGLILIGEGTYHGSMEIRTKGVTVRGLDRNKVVLDGQGTESNGIIGTAEGITVENLTVTSYLLNGVLITGLTDDKGHGIGRGSNGYQPVDPKDFPIKSGFAIRSVTATNNGLYGLYALNRSDGVIEDSYASGSADSGIYVGQCDPCNIVVRNNITEFSAVGIETANASAPLAIVGNRTSRNRVGMLIMSNYQETYIPSTGELIAGNVVTDNANPATPEQASGAFGNGIVMTAPVGVQISKNLITSHPNYAALIMSESDLAPRDIQIINNTFAKNGTDVGYAASKVAPGSGNCQTGAASTFPKQWPAAMRCPAKAGAANPAMTGELPLKVPAPAGMSFLDVSLPGDQPGLSGDPETLPHGPAKAVEFPTLASIKRPAPSLFADLQQ